MGVDAKLYLPSNARLNTVTDVVCRLLDAPMTTESLGDKSDAWYASPVKGVVTTKNYMPEMVGVHIKKIDPKIYGQSAINFGYHFEFGGPRRGRNNGGSRGIIMRAYAVNIALLCKLADFFGGTVDFCDCDDEEADYLVLHKSDAENCPESDRPWQDLQERIMDVQPLTQDEIDSYEKRASYHETEIDRAARLNAPRKTKK